MYKIPGKLLKNAHVEPSVQHAELKAFTEVKNKSGDNLEDILIVTYPIDDSTMIVWAQNKPINKQSRGYLVFQPWLD